MLDKLHYIKLFSSKNSKNLIFYANKIYFSQIFSEFSVIKIKNTKQNFKYTLYSLIVVNARLTNKKKLKIRLFN